MTGEEKKKLSPLAVAAGAVASVISMIVGSFFGASGTIFGAALSSVTCSVGAFLFEDRTRRAHARIKARKERGKTPGDEFHRHLEDMPLERAIYETRTREHLRRDWNLGKRLMVSAGMLALCLGSTAVTLVTVEKATGKTLSSSFGGPAQYGTTLGGHSTVKPFVSPSASFSASPSPSRQSTSVSPSVTLSSSATVSSSPDASPSPDLTPSSASPLPSGQVP
jgi:hypothetical protein